MVGGWIISIIQISRGVSALWCVDRYGDECAVDVEDAPAMPIPGDEVWWQSGKVYWDNDRRELRKIGYSYDPSALIAQAEGES